MARVKAIERNAEAEAYRPELIADEEPKYLRRQKPVEIRRKKFSGKSWPFYRKVFVWSFAGIGFVTAGVIGVRFLLYAPQMILRNQDQFELMGNQIVSREAVLNQFLRDRGHSVLQVPLDTRRSELEQLPWVETASVERILPNRIRIELKERTPIAFVRNGNELALIDGHGVILDRPRDQDLHFPIVSGVSEDLPREQREHRMQTYQEFMKDIELVKAGSAEDVSEVELGNPKDLRVVMTGLARGSNDQAVTIHFGAGDFTSKYRRVVENFPQWQAQNGHLQSIDLQYSRQVVLNSDSAAAKK